MNEPSTTAVNNFGHQWPKRNDKMPECKHNFFAVREDPILAKVKIVCAWCGQVRELSSNGEVAVLKHKGTLRYEVQ